MQTTSRDVGALADALRSVFMAGRRAASSVQDTSTVVLLGHLVTHGPLRASELAGRACLDPSTVSRRLRVLEDDGHLMRTPDPEDRRATLLQVTASGRRLVQIAREQRLALLRAALADWTDEDLATLTELTRRLADELEVL